VEELSKSQEEETLFSDGRDTEESLNSSTLTMQPRQSSPSNTKTDHLTSRDLAEEPTFKSGKPMEDGGKCSNSEENMLSTRKERYLMFKEELIERTKISSSGDFTTE
jgi:hypothetical protein